VPATRKPAVRGAVPLLAAALLLACGQSPRDVRNLRVQGEEIVVLGDSLTRGEGAGPGEDIPSVMARELGAPVHNAGVSGDTTAGALERLEADVLSRKPRLVVIALGGNDILSRTPPAEVDANLAEIVRRVQRGGAMAAVVGYRFHLMADLRKPARRVAGREGAWYVADPLKGLFDNQAYKSDMLHLNAAGYEIAGKRIAASLRPLLEAADRARGTRRGGG
jgi:acyl-CoA thioesterase-1